MTENEIKLFHESFRRCLSKGDDFFDLFYEDLLGSSEEVREKLASTDLARLKRALRTSLYVIMTAAVKREPDLTVLEKTARRHSRDATDIPPHLYPKWLDSMVRTVAVCDEEFSSEIEEVWRKGFQAAIDYIVARY